MVDDTRTRVALPVLSAVCMLLLALVSFLGVRRMKKAQGVKGIVVLAAALLVCMVVL